MSENVKPDRSGRTWSSRIAQEDVLAVHADAALGADLWIDPLYYGRIILSDRLIRAEARRNPRTQKPMRPCTVIA